MTRAFQVVFGKGSLRPHSLFVRTHVLEKSTRTFEQTKPEASRLRVCFSQPGVPQLLRADSFYPLLFGSYYDDRPVARARDGVRAFRL